MKRFIRKAKGLTALALSAALIGVNAYSPALAYAAETAQTAEDVAAEESEGLPVLTYEAALDKAKKRSNSLLELQETNDLLSDIKGDLFDSGVYSLPNYDYQKWVNAAVYSYTSALYSADNQLKQTKYNEAILKLSLEATLKSTFSGILEAEANLELTEASLAIQKTQYEQAQVKNRLGMLSDYDLNQQKVTYESSKVSLSQLEKSLEQYYTSLNDLIGEDADKRWQLEYDVTFEPYELSTTIENYINQKINNDYTVLLAELAADEAKFNKNYITDSVTNTAMKNNDYSYASAQRSLKETKNSKEIAIRNAYLQLLQSEESYKQAVLELEQAQADYKTAEINYSVGNITKLALDQAALAVTQKESALQTLAYSYDMQVYTFENTSLLGSSAA